jgi:hypothetical protein
MYVLSASTRPELIRATLSTLHAFLSWIPLGYIFESNLVSDSVSAEQEQLRMTSLVLQLKDRQLHLARAFSYKADEGLDVPVGF